MNSETTPTVPRCAFCYPSEHGRNGEVKREWSIEWTMFIPVCRTHSDEIEKVNGMLLEAKAPEKEEPL